MSKFVILARCYNEPDNNTPSDEIFAKVIECDEDEAERYVKVFEDDLYNDYPYGVEIQAIPIERITDAWEKVIEIW